MIIHGVSTTRILGPNSKTVLIPFFVVLLTLVLFIYLVNFAYTNIPAKLEQLKKEEAMERTLEEKLTILQDIRTTALERSNDTLLALPDKNPVSLTISQVRRFIRQESLLLESLESRAGGGIGGEGLSSVGINVKIDRAADLLTLIDFLEHFQNVKPVVALNDAKITRSLTDGLSGVEFNVSVYWSDLPAKIPEVSEPINRLSNKDMELLDKITGLTPPEFSVLSPQVRVDRVSPFTLQQQVQQEQQEDN